MKIRKVLCIFAVLAGISISHFVHAGPMECLENEGWPSCPICGRQI